MRRSVIAAWPVLGWTGIALAQSSVTIYGSMDLSMPWISDVRGSSVRRMDAAIAQPDLWGLRGTEDLGGGLRASFDLENGFLADTGSPISSERFFNRASWVGLDGAFGAVRLGRQVDLSAGTLSVWGNGYQLFNFYLYHPGNLDGLSSQFPVDNAVSYWSPALQGFRFGALYGSQDAAGRTDSRRTYSLAGTYTARQADIVVAYTDAKGRAFDIAGSTGIARAFGQDLATGRPLAIARFQVLGIGGGYRLDSLPLRLNALLTRSTLQAAGRREHMDAADLGLAWNVNGPTWLNLGYSYSRFGDTQWRQLHLGARYYLSPRVQLHASVTRQHATGGVAAMNAVGVAAGRSQSVLSGGLHLSF